MSRATATSVVQARRPLVARRSRLVWLAAVLQLSACRYDDGLAPVPEEEVTKFLGDLCQTFPTYSLDDGCECRGPSLDVLSCGDLAESMTSAARGLELTYDIDCFGHIEDLDLDHILSGTYDQCTTDREVHVTWVSCEQECQVYFGDAEAGEPCERAGRRMSTCAQGLVCGADDVCHAPCDAPLEIPIGAACGYRAGFQREGCAAGLVCSADPGTCVVAPATGTACDPTAPVCAQTDGCFADTSMCTPRLAMGEPCSAHGECVTNVCDQTCLPPDSYACANFRW